MPDFGIMRGFNEKLFGDKLVAGQLPTQLGLIGSFTAFDSDAQAFFDRVTAAGGSLSATEKSAVNTLVVQMKANSIWTPMKAIYPMVGASAAACAQNLKSSSFTGTFTSGWTFASTGVTGNGISAYMDTNFSPFVNLTNTNSHFMIYLRNVSLPLVSVCDFGAFSDDFSNRFATNYFSNPALDTTNFDVRKRTTVSNSLIGSGFALYSRSASNLAKVYFNNSIVATDTSSTISYNLPDITVYLSALHRGAIAQNFTNRQNAFASIGDSLTDTQASNFYTAVQAFQTTLSRQV